MAPCTTESMSPHAQEREETHAGGDAKGDEYEMKEDDSNSSPFSIDGAEHHVKTVEELLRRARLEDRSMAEHAPIDEYVAKSGEHSEPDEEFMEQGRQLSSSSHQVGLSLCFC